ncbi:MAG: nucleotidyltransferase family protein [Chitinophagales bacterium]|nr:nucleotidyltransferase family protein [Chitinophagales bacterium]
MLTKDVQQTIIERIKPYKPTRIGIFGSYSRDEQTEGSDLDILIDFKDSIDLFDLVGLEQQLSELIGVKVDLVTEASVHPSLRTYILADLKLLLNEEG